MLTNAPKSSSSEKFDPMWVHSLVDDYGLSPDQMRIYVRIRRRGACFESFENMAAGCGMGLKRVRKAVRFLISRRLVISTERPGQTWILEISREEAAYRTPLAKTDRGTQSHDSTPSQNGQGCTSQSGQGYSYPKRTGEVYPIEVTPHKDTGPEEKKAFEYRLKGKAMCQAAREAAGLR